MKHEETAETAGSGGQNQMHPDQALQAGKT